MLERSLTKLIALTACVCSLAGCDTAEQSGVSDRSGIVAATDSSGWFRVPDDVPGPPILSISAHGIAHQTLAIGLADGPLEYLFGNIADVAVGRDGDMVVADPQAGSVSVFDRNGQFVRYVGRDGDGPGEHRRPASVAVADDGVIGVCGRRGLTVFEQMGRVLKASIAMPIPGGWCRLTASSSGGMIVSKEPPGSGDPWMLVLSASGAVTDSFPAPPPQLVINPDTLGFLFAYSPTMISEWRPDGSRIHVWTADPVIEVDRAPRDPAGGASLVRLDIERVPLLAGERRVLMDAIQLTIDRGRTYSETPDEIVERYKPVIAELGVGNDGLLWIRSSAPTRRVSAEERVYGSPLGDGWGEDVAWFLVDVDKMTLRSFEVPFPINLFEAAGDTIWAGYTSAESVPMLGRFEIRW